MPSPKQNLLRMLPSVERILQDAELKRLAIDVPRKIVVDAARAAIDSVRDVLQTEMEATGDEDSLRERVMSRVRQYVEKNAASQYGRAINATGIILHTGLGRAVLPSDVIDRIAEDLSGYSVLQVGVASGKRSKRDEGIERMLRQLTGVEAATLVNNNAAATAITLNTVGAGKEVIVSRGQLVEIGGAFRLPDVMEMSGAKLVAVGTTNKTHARDYENAITENTAAILRVHPSNYKISGFTSEVSLEELVRIAHANDLAMIDDLGAGALVDMAQFGFDPEPLLKDSVKAGADLITCSADKLIGASQGGIILGRAEWVAKVRKNPFARIVRPGKLTLSAVETTLALFLDEKAAMERVPTLRMLQRPIDELKAQAERIASTLHDARVTADVEVVDGFSQMGSGSLPGQNLPTHLVAITSGSLSPTQLTARLRQHATPVFARIQSDRVLLDPRTLLEGDEPILVEALTASLGSDQEETADDA